MPPAATFNAWLPLTGRTTHKGSMPTRVLRLLVLLLTLLGLLMPRVSGAAASIVPGGTTVVICTGQGMMTLRIDETGKPVPIADQPDHCILAHAVDTTARAEVPPLLAPLVDRVSRPTGDLVRAEGYRAARPPPRAPPAA